MFSILSSVVAKRAIMAASMPMLNASSYATDSDIVKLEIYRWNGESGKPYVEEFTLDTKKCGPMVLDALIHVKNYQDPTLTFRRSCREGICGSCSMNIGGTNTLACLKGIKDAAIRGTVRIYPLPHLPLVKDLVPDMFTFYNQHKSVEPWLHLTPEQEKQSTEILQSKEQRAELDGLYECILCACCATSCPSYWWHGEDEYLGPAVLLQAYRWIKDSRDNATKERIQGLVDHPKLISVCHKILNCTRACPKHLDPAEAIMDIKERMLLQSEDNIVMRSLQSPRAEDDKVYFVSTL